MVTVEGCLMLEKDVPGREPNVAERAGVMEDYILASARVVKGTAPQTADATRAAGQPATGQPGSDAARTSGGGAQSLAPMYDVKNLDGDRLKPLVGKRVQIEGRLSDTNRNEAAGSTKDLVDIQGANIREVPGQCAPR
jgi:hypothetical protein